MTRPDLEDDADFVIVGTGAGGATAARVLSAAGYSVVMLEEGPRLRPEERAKGLVEAMSQSMRDMATVTTSGGAPFPLLQGRCVGGSTAINSGIIWRLPDDVRASWAQQRGLHELLEESSLHDVFTRIETELSITTVPEELLGGNGRLLRHGAQALQLPGRPIRRNARDCEGSARCLQGCPSGARQSMDNSYVPMAEDKGARLHSLAKAQRVLFTGGRATGVEGTLLDSRRRGRGRFQVRAKRAVVLAAGAVWTPMLLLASGVRRLVGQGFMAHPGAAIVGRFGEPVGMGHGATQAYEVPMRSKGFKLESISLPPELLAARLPGVGDEWQRRLRRMDYYAQWSTIIRMGARGRVARTLLGGPKVSYEPTATDVEVLKRSVALLVEVMFAAGAEEVYPGVAGLPEVFTDREDAALLLDPAVQRRDFHLMASHHFASTAAGADPASSVLDPNFACHDVQGLYVMDGGALPTNLGVNPQHTIMALCWRAADRLANQRHSQAAA